MTAPQRPCVECGNPFSPREAKAMFCCDAHRKTWGNRRMLRGAQLYDLFMALRYERAAATEAEVWKVMCRVAAEFREEDNTERAGRLSWYALGSPQHILVRLPYLLADILAKNLTGAKR